MEDVHGGASLRCASALSATTPCGLSGSTVTRLLPLASLEGRSTAASKERNTKRPAGEAVVAGRGASPRGERRGERHSGFADDARQGRDAYWAIFAGAASLRRQALGGGAKPRWEGTICGHQRDLSRSLQGPDSPLPPPLSGGGRADDQQDATSVQACQSVKRRHHIPGSRAGRTCASQLSTRCPVNPGWLIWSSARPRKCSPSTD